MVEVWLHPPVGIFIGLLGLLGVVVPLVRKLETMGRWEKAGWTLIMFVLMGLELRSIDRDRADNEMKQAAARTELLTNFQKIANGITSEITTSKTGFDATMKRSDTILNGIDENIKIANGGDSYAYVVMSPINGGFDVYVIQDGNYHLLDAVVSVIDLDKFEAAVKTGQIFDRRRYEVVNTSMPLLYRGRALVVGTLPLDGGDYKRYNSTIFARNGVFSELSRLKRVGDTWKSAFVVSVSYYNGKKGIACEKIDKEFPHELVENDKDWTSVTKLSKLSKFDVAGQRLCPK